MVFLRKPGDKLFLKMLGASLLIHIALLVFFNLNPWPTIMKVRPSVYTVTLMPVSLAEPNIPTLTPPPIPKEEKIKPVEKIKPLEKVKPVEKPKKDDIVEKVKKKEKEIDPEVLDRLRETLEETRKKIAIDEIQKKVARREPVQEKPPVIPPPKISSTLESNLEDSYSKYIENKIKEEWTLPENLIKEKEWVDLEAIIVIIIERNGKIQKWWFEKKSGNALYDQSAMRAIKKAEPLPPIPRELNKELIEFGIRFRPD